MARQFSIRTILALFILYPWTAGATPFPGLSLVYDADFASLSSGDYEISRDYTFSVFGPDFGPDITALGPSLALNGGTDVSASVRMLDFQIFTTPIPKPPTCMLAGSGALLFALSRPATKATKDAR